MEESWNITWDEPRFPDSVFIAPGVTLVGDIRIGDRSSVWFGAVLRGDMAPIVIGERTNLQDGVIAHVDTYLPLTVGDDVTVGHGAIIHACTIGDRCLIGMGSTVLTGAVIGEESIVAAGAVVTEGKEFEPRSLIVGVPGRKIRSISEGDMEIIRHASDQYLIMAEMYQKKRQDG